MNENQLRHLQDSIQNGSVTLSQIEFRNPSLLNNKEIALTLVDKNENDFEFLPEQIKNNNEIRKLVNKEKITEGEN